MSQLTAKRFQRTAKNAEEFDMLNEDFKLGIEQRELVAQLCRMNRNIHLYGVTVLVLGVLLLVGVAGIYPFIAGHF